MRPGDGVRVRRKSCKKTYRNVKAIRRREGGTASASNLTCGDLEGDSGSKMKRPTVSSTKAGTDGIGRGGGLGKSRPEQWEPVGSPVGMRGRWETWRRACRSLCGSHWSTDPARLSACRSTDKGWRRN